MATNQIVIFFRVEFMFQNNNVIKTYVILNVHSLLIGDARFVPIAHFAPLSPVLMLG